jgi:hypothetical protein
MKGTPLPTWWSIGRLVGHVEPIASVQKETHGDALAWAVAEYELRPEEIVISQVPPGRLGFRKPPPKGTK